MRNVLLVIGSALPMLSAVIYVASILAGKTKPHRMTYLLLTLITGLSFASLIGAHDTSGVWLAGVSFGQCLIVLGLAWRRGMGGKDPFDLVCLCLCLAGVATWLMTGESLFGLLASMVADFLAVLPSMRKMWRHPYTEIWLFYTLDAIASIAILAAGPFTGQSVLYPLYLLGVNALCAAIILGRRGRVQIAALPEKA